jgi:hypothetical protein
MSATSVAERPGLEEYCENGLGHGGKERRRQDWEERPMLRPQRMLFLLALAIPVTALPQEPARALLSAALRGNTEEVLALVSEGVDVNGRGAGGWTALRNGRTEVMRLLNDAGAEQ